MIVDERLTTYINSLGTSNTKILDTIEKEALQSFVHSRDGLQIKMVSGLVKYKAVCSKHHHPR